MSAVEMSDPSVTDLVLHYGVRGGFGLNAGLRSGRFSTRTRKGDLLRATPGSPIESASPATIRFDPWRFRSPTGSDFWKTLRIEGRSPRPKSGPGPTDYRRAFHCAAVTSDGGAMRWEDRRSDQRVSCDSQAASIVAPALSSSPAYRCASRRTVPRSMPAVAVCVTQKPMLEWRALSDRTGGRARFCPREKAWFARSGVDASKVPHSGSSHMSPCPVEHGYLAQRSGRTEPRRIALGHIDVFDVVTGLSQGPAKLPRSSKPW